MPSEAPNPKIEELLRRYSAQRREQGGEFSIHPATRRMLHAEVAQKFGQPARKSGWSGILALFAAWRNPAFVCAIVAVLAAGVWMFWNRTPGRSETDYAKLETPRAAQPVSGMALKESADLNSPATAPEPLPTGSTGNSIVATHGDRGLMTGTNSTVALVFAGTPAPPAAPSPSLEPAVAAPMPLARFDNSLAAAKKTDSITATENSVQLAAKDQRSDSDALQKQKTTAPARMGATGFSGGRITSLSASPAQRPAQLALNSPAKSEAIGGASREEMARFYRAPLADRAQVGMRLANFARVDDRQPADKSLYPALLTQFSIRNQGGVLQIVDTDNSVYTLVPNEPAAIQDSERRLRSREISPLPVLATSPGGEMQFRAAGTNRTLNQLVVITGEFSPLGQNGPANSNLRRTEAKEARGRGIAAQIVPTSPSVPSTTPTASATAVQPSVSFASITNAASVHGTLRIGTFPERPFRALRVDSK